MNMFCVNVGGRGGKRERVHVKLCGVCLCLQPVTDTLMFRPNVDRVHESVCPQSCWDIV